MAYENYQKDTPEKYLHSAFENVSMTEAQMAAYNHEKVQEEATKLAAASEHKNNFA
jgi:Sec7-like guanine-nucleotide exchange factor